MIPDHILLGRDFYWIQRGYHATHQFALRQAVCYVARKLPDLLSLEDIEDELAPIVNRERAVAEAAIVYRPMYSPLDGDDDSRILSR